VAGPGRRHVEEGADTAVEEAIGGVESAAIGLVD
jgi:hypothetical protein